MGSALFGIYGTMVLACEKLNREGNCRVFRIDLGGGNQIDRKKSLTLLIRYEWGLGRLGVGLRVRGMPSRLTLPTNFARRFFSPTP